MAKDPEPLSELEIGADPRLTCSLYATGAIERAIREWILPFRRRWRKLDVHPATHLWLWRHLRHGEHLKLRVHCTARDLPILRGEAEEAALRFLQALPPRDPNAEVKSASRPAIDADEDDEPLPQDRSFRFTSYVRQAPILGPDELTEDDLYTSRFLRCLGSAHDWMLESFEHPPQGSGNLPFRCFTNWCATAIDLAFTASEAVHFLAFYRDWLIRLPLLRQGADQAVATAWTRKIHARAMAIEQQGVGQLLADPWREQPAIAKDWQNTLLEFCDGTRKLRQDKGLRLQSSEGTLLDEPLTKVLLALANVLGYSLVEQAVVVHLLLWTLDENRASQSIVLDVHAG